VDIIQVTVCVCVDITRQCVDIIQVTVCGVDTTRECVDIIQMTVVVDIARDSVCGHNSSDTVCVDIAQWQRGPNSSDFVCVHN
jgi:hypothetical protein